RTLLRWPAQPLKHIAQPSHLQHLLHTFDNSAHVRAQTRHNPLTIHSYVPCLAPHQPDQIPLRPHHPAHDTDPLRPTTLPTQRSNKLSSTSDPPSASTAIDNSATTEAKCSAIHAITTTKIKEALVSPTPKNAYNTSKPPTTMR